MIRRTANRPLQHLHNLIQAAGNISIDIVRFCHGERWLDEERMAAVLPCGEHGHDHRAGIAGNPYRSGRQRCLMAEKPDGLAILKEIAIGQKHRALATAQRLNDSPDS